MTQKNTPIAPTFVSENHLKAIGNLITHWGWLELTVQTALRLLLKLSRREGLILTTHIGLVSLIDTLKMLTCDRYGAESKRFTTLVKILDQIEPLRIERNNIVHNIWLAKHAKDSDIAAALKISARGKLKFDAKDRTSAQIDSVTIEVCAVVREFRGYLMKHHRSKRDSF